MRIASGLLLRAMLLAGLLLSICAWVAGVTRFCRCGVSPTREPPWFASDGAFYQGTVNSGVLGLMVWQRSANTMRWTNGGDPFTYSGRGLQQLSTSQTFAREYNPSLLNPMQPGACSLT